MKKQGLFGAILYFAGLVLIFFTPAIALASGKEESELTHKVSTVNLKGISLWLINMYNDDRLLFAVIVTMTMGLIGVVVALLTELILKALGVSVSKMAHHE